MARFQALVVDHVRQHQRKQMLRALVVVFAASVSAQHAIAQSEDTGTAPAAKPLAPPSEEATKQCLAAVQEGDATLVAAWKATLLSWRNVANGTVQLGGRDCLNAIGGGPWAWDWPMGRFRTKVETDADRRKSAELQKTAQKAAIVIGALEETQLKEKEQHRQNAVNRTVAACFSLLSLDEVSALTNPVCSPIFLANGLPD